MTRPTHQSSEINKAVGSSLKCKPSSSKGNCAQAQRSPDKGFFFSKQGGERGKAVAYKNSCTTLRSLSIKCHCKWHCVSRESKSYVRHPSSAAADRRVSAASFPWEGELTFKKSKKTTLQKNTYFLKAILSCHSVSFGYFFPLSQCRFFIVFICVCVTVIAL